MEDANYYTSEREEIFPFVPDHIKRTLDVGCASGFFSARLKQEKQVETWGIEMVKEVAEKAKSRVDHVLAGSFDQVYDKLPSNYFDCIFFNDVLEHMVEPEDCLRKIKEKLSSEGCIIASLPNIRYIDVLKELLIKKDWEYKDSGILDRTHLRFFTRKSMIRMFENCGYKVQIIKGIRGVSPYSFTSIINKLVFNVLDDLKYKQFMLVVSPE